jgi:hypothetical protein
MAVPGVDTCDRKYALTPSRWGCWDTSSPGVWCDGGPNDGMGDFEVLPGVSRPQFGIIIPEPFADRISVHLASVAPLDNPQDVVPVFEIALRDGAGNASSTVPWGGGKVDCNVNGGFACKDWLFQVRGQLVNFVSLWTRTLDQVPRKVRINLRLLIDQSYGGDQLVVIPNPNPPGFVTKL